jgi:hypothetical protein
MLIDCGLIGVAKEPKKQMSRVVADIAATCRRSRDPSRLDVVVMTHEHWDHASGFSKDQMQSEFDKIEIGEVWYAWTENPRNLLGQRLRRERELKLNALECAARALTAKGNSVVRGNANGIVSMLGFFGISGAADLAAAAKGAKVGRTRAAFDYLRERRGVKKRYCKPTEPPISLEGVSGVRAYVLGPPEDEGMLKRSAPTRKGREVYEFSADAALAENLTAAFERMAVAADASRRDIRHGRDCPFDSSACRYPGGNGHQPSAVLTQLIASEWSPTDEQWRQIEDDWASAATDLALNLDSHTNNTCLVIALELLPSRRVLLFAADAQVGNWLSWQDTSWTVKDGAESRTVTGPDLLQKTVFYKVGHHGSHNATLRAMGLEQMGSTELVAFVPVFKKQAQKAGWNQMPFRSLVDRLREKTQGRLIFSGEDALPPNQLKDLTAREQAAFKRSFRIGAKDLYYEFAIELES